MRVGRLDKLVTLFKGPTTYGDSDGFAEALNPPTGWAAIDPQGPTGDGRTVSHLITMRFHPQVTMDCWLVYADPVLSRSRQFIVRGFQNVSEQNDELRLFAEEVVP